MEFFYFDYILLSEIELLRINYQNNSPIIIDYYKGKIYVFLY